MPTVKTVEVNFTFVYVDKLLFSRLILYPLVAIVIVACISTLIITVGAYTMHGVIRLS